MSVCSLNSSHDVKYLLCFRSGTDEQVTELTLLLEDISAWYRDIHAKAVQKAKPSDEAGKAKEKDVARQIRDAAMRTLTGKVYS